MDGFHECSLNVANKEGGIFRKKAREHDWKEKCDFPRSGLICSYCIRIESLDLTVVGKIQIERIGSEMVLMSQRRRWNSNSTWRVFESDFKLFLQVEDSYKIPQTASNASQSLRKGEKGLWTSCN